MGLSSVAAIAFNAMQAQNNNLSATADDIANVDTAGYVPQGGAQPSDGPVDVAASMAEMSEEEMAYRANAEAFETGADLWALLNVVSRD